MTKARLDYSIENLSDLLIASEEFIKKAEKQGYNVSYIPKSSGGSRKIEEPEPALKALQQKLITFFRSRDIFKPSYFSHAFMQGRNIVTAAEPHVGKKYLFKTDISDFFNSISYRKFKRRTGLNWKRRKELNWSNDLVDGIIKFCFKENADKKYLPQGAPTSPRLSNHYLKSFDWLVASYGAKPATEYDEPEKSVYFTRYADDIFLSSDSKKWLSKTIKKVNEWLTQYSMKENRDKRRLMSDGQRKAVCGIVVNEKLNLPREKRKEIRAALHNAQYDERGLDAERFGLRSFRKMVENQENFPDNNIEVFKGKKFLEDMGKFDNANSDTYI